MLLNGAKLGKLPTNSGPPVARSENLCRAVGPYSILPFLFDPTGT